MMVLAFEKLGKEIEGDCGTICMKYRERHGIKSAPLHCKDEVCYGKCPFTAPLNVAGAKPSWILLEESEYMNLVCKASLYDEMQGRHNQPHGEQFNVVKLQEAV
jgi:hypothetical protein